MALGAERSQVLGLVMRSGLQIVLGGLVIGTLGTFFAVRVLKSMLFGVSTFDPASTGFALLLIVLTACAAALVPARRAASTEPMTALRTE
jgi:ABC-type antimicrobial peptide transport system permease subunit